MDAFLKQEVIGKEYNEKLNNLIADYFQKRKFEKLGFIPRPGAIGVIHTLEDGMIKNIGGSDPFDIINDNFGKWFGSWFSVPSNAFADSRCLVGLGNEPIDINGSSHGTSFDAIYGQQNGGNNWSGLGGLSRMQIGAGLTPPTVSDINIETPFVGGLESTRILVSGGSSYIPTIARVATAASIGPVTGAGTINELCLFTDMSTRFPQNFTFLFSHDTISPGVPFIGGETIFAQYFWQL
jgi:hypothetical protein